MQMLTALNEAGRTIVAITHEQEIADFAKRIIRPRDGRIVSVEVPLKRRKTARDPGASAERNNHIPDALLDEVPAVAE